MNKIIYANWICLVLGIVFMFISLGTFFIYAPLLLVSFILSIVLLSKGSVGNGLTMLLTTIIFPPIIWLVLVAYRTSDALNNFQQEVEEQEYKFEIEKQQEKISKIENIKFEEVRGYTEREYMHLEGRVRNLGDQELDYIQVKVECLDDNGKVLDTDFTYAVGGEGLGPQQAKSFQIMTPSHPDMAKFRYYVDE